MHRLYLYYCYQLGILPKKQQPRINRPELERIWKDTEKILAEHAFVRDHKFPSLQAIVDYRKGLSQQMETLAAQRAEVVKQMQCLLTVAHAPVTPAGLNGDACGTLQRAPPPQAPPA